MSSNISSLPQAASMPISQGVFHASLAPRHPNLLQRLAHPILPQGLIWAGLGLCVIAFSFRVHVRVVCFGRLFIDDWFMLATLAILLATDIICQSQIYHIYHLFESGLLQGPDFVSNTQAGLRAFGINVILGYVGIWLIKINFLLFFYRLGNKLRRYLVAWWIVVVLTVACGVVELAIMKLECIFGPILNILKSCNSPSSLEGIYARLKVSCALDIFTDAMIIGFPISILWQIRISLARKIVIAAIFTLVVFTIIVTVIRGSIFGVYEPIDQHSVKGTIWIWFWFAIEFHVSFLIACLVSYRALYANKDKQVHREMAAAPRSRNNERRTMASRLHAMHASLLETCRSLEATHAIASDEPELPVPPQPRLSVDFALFPGPKPQPVARGTCTRSSSRGGVECLTDSSTLGHGSSAMNRAV
ncbi:hypothetical protein CDD81_1843 [Ophiocordyceps australis]|uniref:Rhodopsin domain-containing protein n=1 Tax=Ophiocordyceps australis TaxID=1399860 RepID=A0A2C5XV35_9HYPO|nr:hypothetical protein CDD81_1843 [Ophiocordyceps australis]